MLSTLGRLNPFSGHARVPAACKRRDRMRLRPSLESLEQKLVLSDISGKWQGTLFQPMEPRLSPSYDMEMDLTQSGDSVQGTEKVSTGPYYAVISLSGSVDQTKGLFNFQGTVVNQQNAAPGFHWFIKSGSLQISADGGSMMGTWRAESQSGSINLSKVAKELPIDLNRWCKEKYGTDAFAVVKEPNVYGWVCIAHGREFPINVAEAAQMEYGPTVKVAFREWNDPYSWYAFFPVGDPDVVTTDWHAWVNAMPGLDPSKLIVTGKVQVANPGVDAILYKEVPQGSNPAILRIDLYLVQKPGYWPQQVTWVEARYEEQAQVGTYSEVNILSDNEVIGSVPVLVAV